MRKKVGIIKVKNSFSDKIIDYVDFNKYEVVTYNSYGNIDYNDLDSFDFFIWHFNPEDKERALGLFTTLELMEVKTFPDLKSLIFFDNKIFQSNLLKSLKINIPSYKIYYDFRSLYKNLSKQIFPTVFKLKGGAGSNNVFLIKSKIHLLFKAFKMFTFGYNQVSRWNNLSNLIKKYFDGQVGLFKVFKGIVRLFVKTKRDRRLGKELGYFYLQEFLPNNKNDIRIIIIGDRCFAFTRYNRKNDFRASGSGNSSFSKDLIPKELIKHSFEIYNKLGMISVAFDFLIKDSEYTLIEISYGFIKDLYENCEGYWTEDLKWNNEDVRPELFIIETLFSEK